MIVLTADVFRFVVLLGVMAGCLGPLAVLAFFMEKNEKGRNPDDDLS